MPGVFQAHFGFRLETSPSPMSSAKMTITFGRDAGAKAARPIPPKPRKPTTPKNHPWSQTKRQPGPRPRSQKRDRMGRSPTLPIAPPFDQPRMQPHARTDSKSTQPQRIEARPPKGQALKSDPAAAGRGGASLGGEHPNPIAQSAKAHRSQSLLSERRPDTAKPRLFCKSLAFTIIPELTLCAFFPTVVSEHHS